MVRATSQQQQLSEFPGEFNDPEFPEGSSTEQETNVNEIQWVPGFIQLTRKTGSAYRIQIAEIVRFEAGAFGEMKGSDICLRGTEDERFVLETPEQIGELIRQAWEGGVSLQAEIRRAVESGEAE